jgi:hypothetical protein
LELGIGSWEFGKKKGWLKISKQAIGRVGIGYWELGIWEEERLVENK